MQAKKVRIFWRYQNPVILFPLSPRFLARHSEKRAVLPNNFLTINERSINNQLTIDLNILKFESTSAGNIIYFNSCWKSKSSNHNLENKELANFLPKPCLSVSFTSLTLFHARRCFEIAWFARSASHVHEIISRFCPSRAQFAVVTIQTRFGIVGACCTVVLLTLMFINIPSIEIIIDTAVTAFARKAVRQLWVMLIAKGGIWSWNLPSAFYRAHANLDSCLKVV